MVYESSDCLDDNTNNEVNNFDACAYARDTGNLVVPIALIQELGLQEATLISEIAVARLNYLRCYNEISLFVPLTIEDVENNCGLGRKTQTRIIKKLIEMGLIQTKNIGLPPIRHFWMNDELLEQLFLQNDKRNNKPIFKAYKGGKHDN